jgi:hypothetical protein
MLHVLTFTLCTQELRFLCVVTLVLLKPPQRHIPEDAVLLSISRRLLIYYFKIDHDRPHPNSYRAVIHAYLNLCSCKNVVK